jgi:hypothetical protein
MNETLAMKSVAHHFIEVSWVPYVTVRNKPNVSSLCFVPVSKMLKLL